MLTILDLTSTGNLGKSVNVVKSTPVVDGLMEDGEDDMMNG